MRRFIIIAALVLCANAFGQAGGLLRSDTWVGGELAWKSCWDVSKPESRKVAVALAGLLCLADERVELSQVAGKGGRFDAIIEWLNRSARSSVLARESGKGRLGIGDVFVSCALLQFQVLRPKKGSPAFGSKLCAAIFSDRQFLTSLFITDSRHYLRGRSGALSRCWFFELMSLASWVDVPVPQHVGRMTEKWRGEQLRLDPRGPQRYRLLSLLFCDLHAREKYEVDSIREICARIGGCWEKELRGRLGDPEFNYLLTVGLWRAGENRLLHQWESDLRSGVFSRVLKDGPRRGTWPLKSTHELKLGAGVVSFLNCLTQLTLHCMSRAAIR
ncbi:MAG: hypothetical protein CSA62_02215 [Planctomycetota bacterium]|nr:MAG: hypothetical protein CSA62_02215 [Planctomycetota bacterium]